MGDSNEIVELACEITEIARTTTDPATGWLLMELVERLLMEAGLPPEDAEGGGESSSPWVSEPVWDPPDSRSSAGSNIMVYHGREDRGLRWRQAQPARTVLRYDGFTALAGGTSSRHEK